MTKRTYLYIIAILIAVFSVSAHGQTGSTTPVIRLKSGNITPAPNFAAWLDNATLSKMPEQPRQVLLQFSKLPDKAEKETLAANGITLLDYIPENTYTAIINKGLNAAKLTNMPIRSVLDMQSDWKMDVRLLTATAASKKSEKVLFSLCAGVSSEDVSNFIRALGGSMTTNEMSAYGYYTADLPASKLRELADWYAVRYVGKLRSIAPTDRHSIPAVKGNRSIAPPTFGGGGLTGEGVMVGIGDNTSGAFHTDTRDRTTNFNPGQLTNHGIHISGIVGGAAILDPLAQSMAPKVSMVNFFFSTVLSATGSMFRDYNMTLTNNSYTVVENDCDYFGTYDLYSRYLDTLSVQYPLVQHVFAAGNDGELSCTPFAPGYGTMGGGYQPAKNNIVVGSISHNLAQAWDQSRGPVRDGRLKPEIVAVGASVYSGLRNDTYGWAGGTSMAAPQVVSGLALLTQRYKQLHGGTQPRGDVLKTILLNGASEIGNPGPDYSYGFGVMNVDRSLNILEKNTFDTGSISTGESQSFTFRLTKKMAQAKIMLCWHDVPASPSSAVQLINDLDLSVTGPGSGTTHLPLVLDNAIANIQDTAIENPDHLNNVEQVIIDNPERGTYTIRVSGYNVPEGPQRFVIAFDTLPLNDRISFPVGGSQVSNEDTMRIQWDGLLTGASGQLELSVDDGANWTPLTPTSIWLTRFFRHVPTGINSGKCRVKLYRNGLSVSDRFVINQPPTVALSDAQCPGYVNIHWSPVPNASAYLMLKKSGAEMIVADTVTDTTYSFSGMPLNETSIVAVQPILDSLPGYRSLAIKAVANFGDCSNTASAGDLMIERVNYPSDGRLLTSTAPGASTTVSLRLRNLYTTDCANYTISYSVNGAPWQTLVNPGYIIPANSTYDISIPGFSFSTPGNYNLQLAITNSTLPDPQHINDSITYTVKCLPNSPLDLTTEFADGFEDLPEFSLTHDSIGISPNYHWDYFNNDDSGRLRSFLYDAITISGNRSVSLDQVQAMREGSKNQLTGTFNLSGYDTATTEIRVDFDYLVHGSPANYDGNLVSARGTDTDTWQTLYNYNFTAYPGTLQQVRSLSLTDAVRKGNINFSTSTQISFGQNDTSLIGGINYGTGITIDNFKLYTVTNDALIAGILSPQPNNCGLPASVPLTVAVKNGVNNDLHNVQVFYSLDGGDTHSAIIGLLPAKQTINFTFPDEMSVTAGGNHSVDVWLQSGGDSYPSNDSLLNYRFRNSKIITQFPYLEQFESDNGGFYADGYLNSWEYGTPASKKIKKAASGTKAWKTNLSGYHNSLEKSYLYSPCYDISQLSKPMLSFSLAEDIENCGGILCDGAYMEYSFDGDDWTKLGDASQGFNWYEATFQLWNRANFSRWHVASVPLPKPPSGKVLHLRFVLFSDPAVTYEGIAVDDIHIFDYQHPILPATENTTITENPTSGQQNNYLSSGSIVSVVSPPQSLGNTTATLFALPDPSNPSRTQYTFPRSYLLQSEERADDIGLSLFLQEEDLLKVLNDTLCPSCTPVTDAYTLGITRYYNDNNTEAENNSLTDDTGGTFTFIKPEQIVWVPYYDGYRADFQSSRMGEFWFNNGGPTSNFPAGVDYLNFLAYRSGPNAQLLWHSQIDTAVENYVLERSYDGSGYTEVASIAADNTMPAEYSHVDSVFFTSTPNIYYRLKWTLSGSEQLYYSPVRKLSASGTAENLIPFNAAMIRANLVLVDWTSYIDGMADHYLLERAIGDGDVFEALGNITATNRYGQTYYYTDVPGSLSTGTRIHYRLTAVMSDGSSIVLPVKTVYWVDGAAVTNIYPNPVENNIFTILWNAGEGSELQLRLSDATGRTLYQSTTPATQWNNKTTLRTGDLPSGIYFVRTTIGEHRHTFKIVYR